jgi:CelD/BcsL family acetyltransferase involved in cellulose biosynthesis
VAEALHEGLAAAGAGVARSQDEIAAVVDLPGSYDDYLAGLAAKQRHEVRRKRRRFEAAHGPPRVVRDSSAEAFGAFTAMHRSVPGEKGEFMTADMEAFFASLLDIEGAVIDVLLDAAAEPVAAVFGFEESDAYYLYNSAYRTEAAAESPGVVLVDRLIARAIEEGRSRFDFLKGDEPYKFKLGAHARPLFVLEGVV